MSDAPKPRPDFLALGEKCGARITGKPDGSGAITIVFSIDAWRRFDAAMFADVSSRRMFVSRLQHWKESMTPDEVLGLLNDCDMLAAMEVAHEANAR